MQTLVLVSSFVLMSCLALRAALQPVKASASAVVAQARAWSGQVTHVIDGDSLLIGNREIRLANIDAPEYQQPYGQSARHVLHDLIHDRSVRVEPLTTDRHGRIVAHITRDDGLDVNAAMVEVGAVYVYRRYTDDPRLIALETMARKRKKGLWSLSPDQRQPPEQWRREHTNKTMRTGFNCAVRKTRCRQMTSCEEARFYLERCGTQGLDGNKDGVPCERLCRPSRG